MPESYLEPLIELSQVDASIFRLIAERKKLEDKIKVHEKSLSQIDHEHQAKTKKLNEQQATYEHEDQRLKHEKQKLVDRRKAISSLPNYKLQEKANKEIEHAAKVISSQEEVLITLLEEIETSEKLVTEAQNKLEATKSTISVVRNDLEQSLIKAEERMSDYQGRKNALTSNIPVEVLEIYTRLLERFPTDAIVALAETTCSGCFLDVGRQQAQQISKNEGVVKCRGCGRILYLAQKQE